MNLAIGSDHAGYEMKTALIPFLKGMGHEITNYGVDSPDSVDYPDFAHPVANAVAEGKHELGILLCGTGNGVCFTANKHQEIIAALAWNTEVAELVRRHNNANILCLPSRFISTDLAKEILVAYFAATFEGGRHQRRIDKIPT